MQAADGLNSVLGPISSGGTISSGELLRATRFTLRVFDASGLYTMRELDVGVTGPGTFRATSGQPAMVAFVRYRATRPAAGTVLISGAGTTQIFDPATEIFTAGPSILNRSDHSATLLGDGRVLLAFELGRIYPGCRFTTRARTSSPTSETLPMYNYTTQYSCQTVASLWWRQRLQRLV